MHEIKIFLLNFGFFHNFCHNFTKKILTFFKNDLVTLQATQWSYHSVGRPIVLDAKLGQLRATFRALVSLTPRAAARGPPIKGCETVCCITFLSQSANQTHVTMKVRYRD